MSQKTQKHPKKCADANWPETTCLTLAPVWPRCLAMVLGTFDEIPAVRGRVTQFLPAKCPRKVEIAKSTPKNT